MSPFPTLDWFDKDVGADFTTLLKVRTQVNETLEPLRRAGTIGKSLDAVLQLTCAADDAVFRVLERHREFLPELFIVSQVMLEAKPGSTMEITARHSRELGFVRCPRCWRWVPTMTQTPHGDVCPRCEEALNS